MKQIHICTTVLHGQKNDNNDNNVYMGHRKIRHRASIEGMKSTILHPHWCVLHKTSSLVQKEPGKGKFATGNENQLLSIDPKRQHPFKSIIETCAVLWASPTLQDFSCKRIINIIKSRINNQSSIIIHINIIHNRKSKQDCKSPIKSLVDFFSRQLLQRERLRLQTTPALRNQLKRLSTFKKFS